jgi:hypothetical protein
MRPYIDVLVEDALIREFDDNIDPIELKWHRDNEDRLIEAIGDTDWMFQIDNQLPIEMKGEIFIPRGIWHRAIKGIGSVKIKIIEK